MRFMIIRTDCEDPSARPKGARKSREDMQEWSKFQQELAEAGVVLAAERLHPTSRGFKMKFDEEKRMIVDGPFTEAKEVVAGFWLWRVKSKEEAVEWLKRSPFRDGEVEVRQVFESEDFAAATPN